MAQLFRDPSSLSSLYLCPLTSLSQPKPSFTGLLHCSQCLHCTQKMSLGSFPFSLTLSSGNHVTHSSFILLSLLCLVKNPRPQSHFASILLLPQKKKSSPFLTPSILFLSITQSLSSICHLQLFFLLLHQR